MATFRKNIKPILDVRGDRTMIVMNSYRFGGEANLMGYWPFNGNANDESGKNHDGTVNGATLTTDRDNNANSAYLFDGNDYIEIGDVDTLYGNDYSWSVWINPSELISSNIYEIITKWRILGDVNGIYFVISNNRIRVYSGNNSVPVFTSTFNLTIDTWYHLVLIIQTGLLSLYINNSFNVSGSSNINLTENDINLRFGFNNSGLTNAQRYFKGKIDDIRIYNKALSTDEIAVLYNE